MDFDPRDFDSRDDERHANTPSRERTSDANQHHRGARTRDSGRDEARSLGRGPASNQKASGRNQAQRDRGSRSRERVLDARERDREPRDTFSRHLWLPSGPEREIVRDRDREYTLRGSTLRNEIVWERWCASRLPSLRSALRGLDPHHALPKSWHLSERRREFACENS
jgi:hypothetical protein